MDKSWMTINNRLTSQEYQQGVKSFLDFATENLGIEDEIRCPRVDCINGTKHSRQVVDALDPKRNGIFIYNLGAPWGTCSRVSS
ncbi:hypothetical protein ACSBR2_007046 [Camellia fascicularis]